MGKFTTRHAAAARLLPREQVAALALAAGLALSMGARGQELLEIDQAVWTDGVDRAQRNYTHAYKSPVALKSVSLWMLVRGSPELLERMKQDPEGRVRIRHVWKKLVAEGTRLDHDQVLDIGRPEALKRLSYEVAQTGYFRWRTWSDKVQLSRGAWKVDVVWDSHEPVMCVPASGEAVPCSYRLEVR